MANVEMVIPTPVAWTVILGRHCTPRCTRAGRLGGVAPKVERSAGRLQKGEVSLFTLMSQRVRSFLDGLVSLSGDNWIEMSLHLIAATYGDCGLSVGEEAGFVVLSGSLARVDTAANIFLHRWIRSPSWSPVAANSRCRRTLHTRNRVAQAPY